MIEGEVHRGETLLMARTYSDPALTLGEVICKLEDYVISEQLNVAGECLLRVRFQPEVNA